MLLLARALFGCPRPKDRVRTRPVGCRDPPHGRPGRKKPGLRRRLNIPSPRVMRGGQTSFFLLALGFAARAFAAQPDPAPSDPQARKWIADLGMHVLAKESGYLGLIATSEQKAQVQ